MSPEPLSNDVGHFGCPHAGTCLDDLHFAKDCKDLDDTVIDILNMNQNLFAEERVSGEESLGFSNSEEGETGVWEAGEDDGKSHNEPN